MNSLHNTPKSYTSELHSKTYAESEYEDNFEEYGAEDPGLEAYGFEDEFIPGAENPEHAGFENYSVSDLEEQLGFFEQKLRADSSLSEGLKSKLQNEIDDAQRDLGFAQGLKGKARENILLALETNMTQIQEHLGQGSKASSMVDELETLRHEISSKEFAPEKQAQQTEWLEKLGKAIGELELNFSPENLAKAEQLLQEIQEKFETEGTGIDEEAKAFETQSWKDAGLDPSKKQEALAGAGLTEADLKSLTLPPSPEMSEKLFGVLSAMDPRLAQMFSENPNPYRNEVTDLIAKDLGLLLPQASEINATAVNRLLEAVPVSYPSPSKIKEFLSGDDYKVHVLDMMEGNNAGNGIEAAIQSGHWDSFLATYINCGDGMDWNKGHAGSTLRRYFGALYGAAGSNPEYFKRLVKEFFPKNIILEISAQLQRNGHAKLPGDLLDKTQLVMLLEECVSDGSGAPLPAPATGTAPQA